MFVAFCGIDGSGKGEQSVRAAKYLTDTFGKCSLMKYPDRTTPLGLVIDRWLKGTRFVGDAMGRMTTAVENALVLQGLFLANKIEVQAKLKSCLRGGHVVADRYAPSAVAYGVADGLDYDWLMSSHATLLQPDLTILLDIPVEESFRRRPNRVESYECDEKRLTVARETYLKMAKQQSKKWAVIDGMQSKDLVSLRVNDTLNWFFEENV